jgi:hypothetical protein
LAIVLDLFEELKNLVTRLNDAQKDYALCGGLALAVYGVTRATVDIDILIPKDSLAEILPIAEELGYRLHAKPMGFRDGAIEIHRVSKIDPETGDLFSLDFLFVTPHLEFIWKNRHPVSWEGGILWVVSRGDLIALKELRGSGQDLHDIQKLKEFPDEN